MLPVDKYIVHVDYTGLPTLHLLRQWILVSKIMEELL